jgi:hypothetical protein
MKTMMLALIFLTASILASAGTTVPPRPLPDLVKASDHVLVGKVVKVDMVDGKGNPVTNNDARTGPGLENVIRLHVVLEVDGALKTTKKELPATIVVRHWTMWHYTLGQWKLEALDKVFIFLLVGEDFQWVYPLGFMRDPSEKVEIQKLLGK